MTAPGVREVGVTNSPLPSDDKALSDTVMDISSSQVSNASNTILWMRGP